MVGSNEGRGYGWGDGEYVVGCRDVVVVGGIIYVGAGVGSCDGASVEPAIPTLNDRI